MKKRLIVIFSVIFVATVFLQAGVPQKKSVAEFLRMSKTDTTFCELTGVVSRVRNHERGRLFIDDGTGSVLIYGLRDAKGQGVLALDIRKGDTLTVRGRRFLYDGRVIEMKNALYVRHSYGPDHNNVPKEDELDREPTFRGKGPQEFSKWVSAHLKYPKEARDAYSDGMVLVKFVVGRNGGVQEVEILKGSHPALNEEALRVVRKSPKWKPGMVDGHSVRKEFKLPIYFSSDF
jgi:TonB family protein